MKMYGELGQSSITEDDYSHMKLYNSTQIIGKEKVNTQSIFLFYKINDLIYIIIVF